jgi:hypothetical protein
MVPPEVNVTERAFSANPPRRHRHRRRRRSILVKWLKQMGMILIYAAAIGLVLYLWEFMTK